MLTENEKRDFAFSTLQPMAAYTLPYLTRVIGVVDEHGGEYRGTGVFLMIGGRQAVVTAAHVLREAAATGRYSSLTFSRGSGEPPAIVAGTIRYFDDIDLAVYLPSRDFPIGRDKAFWPGDRIEHGVVRAKTDYLFAQGFPDRVGGSSTRPGGLISETVSSGAMMRLASRDFPRDEVGTPIPPDALPDGIVNEHEFAFDFSIDAEDSEDPNGSTSPDVAVNWRERFVPGESPSSTGRRPKGAHGLSGSPVWRIGANDGPIRDWAPPVSRLVGIVTDWDPDQKVLIATSAGKLLDISPEL